MYTIATAQDSRAHPIWYIQSDTDAWIGTSYNNREDAEHVADLLEDGSLETCRICGRLSAYAWCDVDEALEIAHMGTSSCWEWECGHCRAHHVAADAPILAAAYTHSED